MLSAEPRRDLLFPRSRDMTTSTWSPKDIFVLKERFFVGDRIEDIAIGLDRSAESVERQARRMGMRRTKPVRRCGEPYHQDEIKHWKRRKHVTPLALPVAPDGYIKAPTRAKLMAGRA